MPDVDAIADIVVTTMRAALAPVLERIAAAEARLGALTDVRDRLIVVETKATAPLLTTEATPPVDLSPLTSRLAAVESSLGPLADLRDRVVVMETKSSMAPVIVPAPLDLSPLTERLSALDARLGYVEASRDVEAVTALHERVAVVETKSALLASPVAVDLGPIERRQDAFEASLSAHRLQVPDLVKEIGALKERLVSVEVRGPIPGPPGPPGKDGDRGKDGQDGIALDDLSVTQERERSVVFRARVGQQVKELGVLTLPVDIYRGVWVDGRTYDCGDGVTWGGSEWHCNDTTTTKPGEGSKHWTLKVKRGRDGKDGRDASGALPVVRTN